MVEEKWKPIPGFEGQYEVSDLGRVRSLDRMERGKRRRLRKGKILKPDSSRLYDGIFLSSYSGQRKFYIHHLVAEVFIGPRPDGMQIDHINRAKRDNRAANLRYVTPAQNRANYDHPPGKSGVTHVHFCGRKNKPWQVRIGRKYVGHFSTVEEAKAAIPPSHAD